MRLLSEKKTIATAAIAPTAPMRLPSRAVFGEDKAFNAKINARAAPKLANCDQAGIISCHQLLLISLI